MSSELTKKGRNTRRCIIDTAFRLFKEYGFDNVSTTRICEEAGVSNGSFFHYFPEKTAILYAFVKDESGEIDAMIPELDELPADVALTKLVNWQADYYQTKGCDFIAHFHSHLIASRKGEDFGYSFTPATAHLIERGQREGVFNASIDPQFAATMLFDTIMYRVSFGAWPNNQDDITIADIIRGIYDAFYEQVLKP